MRVSGRIALLTAAAVMVAGCNADGSRNRALTGGVIGGTVGAALGNPVTTVAGASAGAAIGASLDRQQRELQQALAGSGATVVNTGNSLVVTLPESVTFDVGSTILHPDYVDEIAFVARSLRDNPNSNVRIIGHTDNTGGTEYNQRLSERRAAAVAQVLFANGVPPSRVITGGAGYSQPVASNDTPGGRAQNRRVEIIIVPTA